MKSKWRIHTRGSDGKEAVMVLDAEDRNALFDTLKQKGITASRVEKLHNEDARTDTRKDRAKIYRVGLFCFITVALCALVSWWFIKPTADKPKEEMEIQPASKPIPKAVVHTQNTMAKEEDIIKVEDEQLPPQKVGEIRDGYIKLASGELHKVRGIITNNLTSVKAKYAIFANHCENDIACLLTIQPGEGLVGTPRYNGRFTKNFLDSLNSPIIINEDDEPDVAELKQAVIEVKKDMKAAYDRGEDLEQIMLDTRAEYQKLFVFKQGMQRTVSEYVKNNEVSDEDIETYVEAANTMLAEKGIAPLKLGPILIQKIRLMKRNQEATLQSNSNP